MKRCVSVDLFVASKVYVDIATMSYLTEITGGETHLYPDFDGLNNYVDRQDLTGAIGRTVTRTNGFEAIMKVGLLSLYIYILFISMVMSMFVFMFMLMLPFYIFVVVSLYV